MPTIKSAKAQKAVVAVADNDKDELFAFTCTSDYANITETLQVPKSKLGSCIDSGASEVYCPDQEKFANYRLINQSITTADGRKLMLEDKNPRNNSYKSTGDQRFQVTWFLVCFLISLLASFFFIPT